MSTLGAHFFVLHRDLCPLPALTSGWNFNGSYSGSGLGSIPHNTHKGRIFSQTKLRYTFSRRRQVGSIRCLPWCPFKMLAEEEFPLLRTSLKALEKTIPNTFLPDSTFLSFGSVSISPECSRSTTNLQAQNGWKALSITNNALHVLRKSPGWASHGLH